jgi:hypothetical protein
MQTPSGDKPMSQTTTGYFAADASMKLIVQMTDGGDWFELCPRANLKCHAAIFH